MFLCSLKALEGVYRETDRRFAGSQKPDTLAKPTGRDPVPGTRAGPLPQAAAAAAASPSPSPEKENIDESTSSKTKFTIHIGSTHENKVCLDKVNVFVDEHKSDLRTGKTQGVSAAFWDALQVELKALAPCVVPSQADYLDKTGTRMAGSKEQYPNARSLVTAIVLVVKKWGINDAEAFDRLAGAVCNDSANKSLLVSLAQYHGSMLRTLRHFTDKEIGEKPNIASVKLADWQDLAQTAFGKEGLLGDDQLFCLPRGNWDPRSIDLNLLTAGGLGNLCPKEDDEFAKRELSEEPCTPLEGSYLSNDLEAHFTHSVPSKHKYEPLTVLFARPRNKRTHMAYFVALAILFKLTLCNDVAVYESCLELLNELIVEPGVPLNKVLSAFGNNPAPLSWVMAIALRNTGDVNGVYNIAAVLNLYLLRSWATQWLKYPEARLHIAAHKVNKRSAEASGNSGATNDRQVLPKIWDELEF